MDDREKRLLESCGCIGQHTHSYGVCNTCNQPVIDWIDAHKTAVEEIAIEQRRAVAASAYLLLRRFGLSFDDAKEITDDMTNSN
jgi:hypothetical protein